MKKLSIIVAIIATGLMMVGCGSSNNTAPTSNTEPQVISYQVSGSVVDGDVVGATVEIYDMNGTLLATTTTDENGNYSVNVEDLPKLYRVVVKGGEDKGVDHEANENDEGLGFEMGAIVERDADANSSEAHINPATTLVKEIVESGELPLEEAEDAVKKGFGVEDNRSLAKIDAQKHNVMNRVGNLIALLAKMTPVEDKDISLKAIAKVVVKAKIKVDIGDTGVNLDDLNLSSIFDEVEGVSDQEVEKLVASEEVIKAQLAKVIVKIKVASTISQEEQKEVVSSYATLQELLQTIDESLLEELDNQKLQLIVTNLEQSIKAVLDSSDLNSSDSDTIDLVSEIIKANLASDIDTLKLKVVVASKSYKKHKKHKIKKLVKYIYKNIDLESFDKFGEMLDDEAIVDELEESANDIATRAVEDGEIPSELDDELSDALASNIAKKVEDGAITTDSIKEANEEVVKNDLLVESLKVNIKIKVKIKAKKSKLSNEDRVKCKASKKVVNTIKVNVKIKKFTQTTYDNSAKFYDTLVATMQDDLDNLKKQIDALELLLLDLNEKYDQSTFDEANDQAKEYLEAIENDSAVDRVKTIVNIKIKIEIKVVTKVDIKIDIDEAKVVEKSDKPRTIKLPQPKLPNMPSEFATPISVTF